MELHSTFYRNDKAKFHEVPEFAEKFATWDSGVVKADFSRFLYFYVYGGFYADLDVLPLRDHAPIISQYSQYKVVVPHDLYHGINLEWAFANEKVFMMFLN